MAFGPAQHLGPFRLDRPLGRGREGQIWAATAPGGGAVAVKVLAAVRAESDRRLEREIRALAGLRHPHIVRLFEQGLVTPAEAERARGHLLAGQAWFAMERADGSLADAPGPMAWTELRPVLVHTLRALAHAHARGVLHLDLKRSNLLRRGQRTLLADFGVALDRSELLERASQDLRGNLATMAPEQLRGDWQALGPWTDLFALGRVIWELATGEHLLPSGQSPAQAWAFAQYPPEPPALPPDMPGGLGELLCLLLAPDPAVRIRRAADLDWALDELQAGRALPWPPTPPPPPTWRRPSHEARAERLERELPGLGLSLHGVRQVPLAGRIEARDALWEALLQVVGSRTPRAICLRGPSGIGKSRLARWLCELAEELGVATQARARFEPNQHDLTRMLETLLGRALGDALPQDPTQATGAMGRVLIDQALKHPVVLWLDDIQWGTPGLDLAERLLDLGRGAVLVVLTARDEALAERPEEAQRLAGLDKRGLSTLPLGPLSNEEMDQMLRDGLDLAWDLVETLRPRCEGKPLFAIHLVDDWVARGLLQPTEDGLRSRPGAELPLPEDLERLWQARVASVCGRCPDPRAAAIALERAAVLGLRVDRQAWAGICALHAPLVQLEAALEDARLATAVPGGWQFEHGMLRESLMATANAERRLPDHHRACVAWLLRDGEPSDFASLRRLGHHLLRAGDPDRAADVLMAAVQLSYPRGRRPWEYPLLVAFGQALDQAGAGLDDPRVAWHRLWLSRTVVNLFSADAAWEIFAEAQDAALASGDVTCQRAVRRYEGVLMAWSGRYEDAVAIERELLLAWEADDAWAQWAQGQTQLVTWYCRLGDLDQALIELDRLALVLDRVDDEYRGRYAVVAGMVHTARGDYEQARLAGEEGVRHVGHRPSTLANVLNNLGEANRHLGRHDEAVRCYAEAVRCFRASGMPGHAVPSLNLGLLHCDQGKWAEAARHLASAAHGLRRAGRNLPLAVALLALMRTSLHLEQPEDFESWWPEASELVGLLGTRNRDIANELEALMRTCEGVGDGARAARIAGLSAR